MANVNVRKFSDNFSFFTTVTHTFRCARSNIIITAQISLKHNMFLPRLEKYLFAVEFALILPSLV